MAASHTQSRCWPAPEQLTFYILCIAPILMCVTKGPANIPDPSADISICSVLLAQLQPVRGDQGSTASSALRFQAALPNTKAFRTQS